MTWINSLNYTGSLKYETIVALSLYFTTVKLPFRPMLYWETLGAVWSEVRNQTKCSLTDFISGRRNQFNLYWSWFKRRIQLSVTSAALETWWFVSILTSSDRGEKWVWLIWNECSSSTQVRTSCCATCTQKQPQAGPQVGKTSGRWAAPHQSSW